MHHHEKSLHCKVARALDENNLSRKAFEKIYEEWYTKPFQWDVHLGLMMSALITKEEFLYLADRYRNHTIVQEEVMAQMSRFKLSQNKREDLLATFLPEPDKRTFSDNASWSVIERIAMQKLLV